jgi:hypothetical protein
MEENASQTAQKQLTDTEKKIGDAALEVQNEFLKTFAEMSREVMSCAAAEVELSLKLSKRLSAARSLPDAIAAYQEWLSEEINARSEDARRFMTKSQKFMANSTRVFSNGGSGVGMST